jgi:hypothetical protein
MSDLDKSLARGVGIMVQRRVAQGGQGRSYAWDGGGNCAERR